MTSLNELIFGSILRRDFRSYVTKVFQELNPGDALIGGWYIDLLCDQIQNMISGKYQKLIINLPPRYLKSIICSIALPTFLLGHKPSTKIMCISYGDELASKLASDCKAIMETKWYKEIFTRTIIKSDKRSTMDFETTEHGGRFSTTVLGAITGRGADWIIMDDPLKPLDALSDTIREKINEAYGNTIFSRLNNKNTGKILLVMQRLHSHDLTGFLQEKDSEFKIVRLPLIAEEKEIWKIKNHITGGISEVVREAGELLHPEREGMNIVESYRNSMGLTSFSAQYQQNPTPVGGGMIKKEWLKRYGHAPIFNRVILSWDTASKTFDGSSYSACVVVGIGVDNKYYLLEVFRGKLEFPALAEKVQEMSRNYEALYHNKTITLIENASSGIQLLQFLNRKIPKLFSCTYRASKERRFEIVSLKLEQEELLFPDHYKSWYKEFEDELLTFPNSPFKDQCDALGQLLNYCVEHKLELAPRVALCARQEVSYNPCDISHIAARCQVRYKI